MRLLLLVGGAAVIAVALGRFVPGSFGVAVVAFGALVVMVAGAISIVAIALTMVGAGRRYNA